MGIVFANRTPKEFHLSTPLTISNGRKPDTEDKGPLVRRVDSLACPLIM